MNKQLKIGLIGGLNDTSKGKDNIDLLVPYLQKLMPHAEFDVDNGKYGWIGIFIANWFYKLTWIVKIIPRIAKAMKGWDVVLVFSNGLNFCMQALKRITNKDIIIISMSGSLDENYHFKQDFKSLHNYHSTKDLIIRASKRLPFTEQGAAGAYGFDVDDLRVFNHDYTYLVAHHHGCFFSDVPIQIMANNIYKILEGET